MTKISCFAKAVNKDAQTNPITPPKRTGDKTKEAGLSGLPLSFK